jgi:hypothetical protein
MRQNWYRTTQRNGGWVRARAYNKVLLVMVRLPCRTF